MNRRLDWLTVAAAIEAVTGLVLIVRPPLFASLLFGAEFSPAGQALNRLAGFALLVLTLACWPRLGVERRTAVRALLVFSLLSAFYLVYLGVASGLTGPLLWPAAALQSAGDPPRSSRMAWMTFVQRFQALRRSIVVY